MKTCLKCGHSPISEAERYCPNCGSKNLAIDANTGSGSGAGVKATKMARVQAYGIDLVLMNLVGVFSIFIPIIPALLVTLYQLLRDTKGASVGKRILGLRVVSLYGLPVTAKQCILRNILFVLPTLALFIPGLGFFADNGVTFVICLAETVRLFSSGMRFGDSIAGTTVVRG